MTTPITMTTQDPVCEPIIEHANLQIHAKHIPMPANIFNSNTEYTFGVLDIKVRNEIPINKNHIHILATIDTSDSMIDKCGDNKTKIEHIHYTLENMLKLFHENADNDISIGVQTFSETSLDIITNVPDIREANIPELMDLILLHAQPSGCTNIEVALKNASEQINNYYYAHPTHEIVHLFLTDGDVTDGSRDYDVLLDLVPINCTNIFIGYGLSHNSELLTHLAKSKGSEYRCIDAIENNGLIYGEIIHNILYKAIENVSIYTFECDIYNFQTNCWVNTLEIGNLSSDQSKKYHIRTETKNINDCKVAIYGKTIIKTVPFQPIHIYEIQKYICLYTTDDLSIYIFRQKTLEMLYHARQLTEKYKNEYKSYDNIDIVLFDGYSDEYNNRVKIIEDNIKKIKNEIKEMKKTLNEFHKIIMSFMRDNNMENNAIMKMLCNDIYIVYKTIGTPIGSMYASARQNSNGKQHVYMCSAKYTETPDDYDSIFRRIPRMNNRQISYLGTDKDNDVFVGNEIYNFEDIKARETNNTDTDNDIDNFIASKEFLSPFSTPGTLSLMREISGNHSIGKAKDL